MTGVIKDKKEQKQPIVSRSSCESGYHVMENTEAEIVWVTHVLCKLHVLCPDRPTLLCDNRSAIFLSQNPISHKQAKHIDIDYHFVREPIEEKIGKVEKKLKNQQRHWSRPNFTKVDKGEVLGEFMIIEAKSQRERNKAKACLGSKELSTTTTTRPPLPPPSLGRKLKRVQPAVHEQLLCRLMILNLPQGSGARYSPSSDSRLKADPKSGNGKHGTGSFPFLIPCSPSLSCGEGDKGQIEEEESCPIKGGKGVEG
ncbi:hypothetical protein LXL04_013800 [Taraxacum kok-saghyz]